MRHLLAHASGLGPEFGDPVTTPERRRIYSNAGFEVIDRLLGAATGFSTADYLRQGVLEPLGMGRTDLRGSAADGAVGAAGDLARWVHEMLQPHLLHRDTVETATSVQFPALAGVLPGFGPQRPNPWGLGLEIRGDKHPHWTSPDNAPATFGHFGRSGVFVWVDPVIGLGLVGLGDTAFGGWSVDLWPRLSSAVIGDHRLGRL
jgi:CubicO group peptidase (beta-lactamase class C family)